MMFINSDRAPPQGPKTWADRWRDVRTAFGNLPRALRLVWEAHRPCALGMGLVTLLAAFLPASQAWTGKLIVDAVVRAINNHMPVDAGVRSVLPFLLLEFGLIILGDALNQGRSLLEQMLNTRLTYKISTDIIRKALALDLHFFEDASFYDKLENARNEAGFRGLTMINTSFFLIQNAIALLSFVGIVVAFSPLVALLLFGATIPAFVAQVRFGEQHYHMRSWHAPEFRQMHYLEYLLTTDSTVKEVKLFGLGEPLLRRFHDLYWSYNLKNEALMRRNGLISLVCGLLGNGSFYVAYAWVIWRAVEGSITLGDMTLYLMLFRQSEQTIHGLFNGMAQLYENGLFMDNLFGFLGLQPQMARAAEAHGAPRPIGRGIEFRGVSFRYPGREEWVLRDVNLHIAPGEKLALVGANGAGKTTLVKLLTRLYDPTEGQILLDGVDLREYDLNDLRERIGVIFQDFLRYQATARENIGFGQIGALGDETRIVAAAKRGGADEVITTLPQGFDTMLGNWFEKGRELSGGQWQKMALGRAFMRDSSVLVLDEPTASLDAEREYEIFQRFRALTDGKIAVLISHRFSTVRMADRIAVLEGGRLTELGTHQELLAQGGTYARLFSMQAEGYR